MSQAAVGALALLMAFSSQADAEVAETAEQSEPVNGQERRIEMHLVSSNGEGKFIGTIQAVNRLEGVLFEPHLEGLPPGIHGFHIHENPDCSPSVEEDAEENALGASPQKIPAGNAGSHLDPGLDGSHSGPYGEGHVGDLPNLYVDHSGTATHPVFVPRVKLMDLEGRSLVIHAEADNYSDDPENGGSGERIACGIAP